MSESDEDVDVDELFAQMERENKRLTRRLEQAEKIIAIQKKIAELLGNPITSDENS